MSVFNYTRKKLKFVHYAGSNHNSCQVALRCSANMYIITCHQWLRYAYLQFSVSIIACDKPWHM